MNRIVECVPNFSEGRRSEVVDAIAAAITSVPDVYLLDREMDADHNRSVITVAGTPEAIAAAAFLGVQAAARLIDLTAHQGAHPRVGAADVIPFIPIRGATIDDCVAIAREVGNRIAQELKIPVYLYEAAASRPDRVNLENIRRGQFEGLREEIEKNPDRRPDFGEDRIHPTAGATVVGARKPLIAYNINLNTPDVDIAKQIAKKIRFSSGGFPFVKGMGVLLKERNLAQVSMNLTDYEQTPIHVVFEAVRREAEQLDVTVAGSEIVGLIPQKALDLTAEHFLQVEGFKPSMVFENRLAEVISNGEVGLRSFIDQVASAAPVPGGGSVAALSGALGAALGQMCVRITKDKKNYQQHGDRYVDALERLGRHTSELYSLIQKDAEAFAEVMSAYKISKDSPEREQAIQSGLVCATEVPAKTAEAAVEALRVVKELQTIIHSAVASDFEVAVQMLRSSTHGAIANMRINLKDIKDGHIREKYENAIRSFEQNL